MPYVFAAIAVLLIILLVSVCSRRSGGKPRKARGGRPRATSPKPTQESSSVGRKRKVDLYFDLLDRIRKEKSRHDYHRVLELCEQSLPLIPALIRDEKTEYGAFNIASIPAIETGLNCWAVLGELEKIRAVESLIERCPDLAFYDDHVQEAYAKADFAGSILGFIKENPGFRQSKLGKAIGLSGQTVRWVVYYLERFGRIQRKKAGNTYELYVP